MCLDNEKANMAHDERLRDCEEEDKAIKLDDESWNNLMDAMEPRQATDALKKLMRERDVTGYDNKIKALEAKIEHLNTVIDIYEYFEGECGDSLHKTHNDRLESAFERLEASLEEIGGR